MGENLFKLVDRKDADLVLGMTEEEIFAITAMELSSYRDLPQIWYQMHTKFRTRRARSQVCSASGSSP